ncbi:hypothetical protein [Piscinibacter terrae]|uniref:MORN repeat-containing protein n=1 Tax=Piscinibacter terrae TaxID=2496871 RepID=A0A3N7K0F9_9BURK|nr:hypothetical protein [Albitalea terrae]RQP26499.1 hypothetical protein DZC73_05695 [Albitalea terrae]
MLIRLAPLILLAFGQAHAELVTDAATGCQVAVPYPGAGEITHWSGECTNGRAQGTGTLTSSNGTFLQGEFRDGKPFNAKGRTVLRFNNGSSVLASDIYDNGSGTSSAITLPQPASPVQTAPLVGRWEWTSNDGRCRETHEYRADGTALVESGSERLDAAYGLMKMNRQEQHAMLRTTLGSNGQPDCMGGLTELHKTSYTVLSFEDGGNSYLTCGSAEKSSCYGRASRAAHAK